MAIRRLIAVVLFSSIAPASSHQQWANGDPVPAWVREACCGVSDAHHMRADQVHVVQGGYRIDGYRQIVPEAKMEPSPDGEYWIFYRDLPSGDQSSVYCLFGPLRGV